MQRKVVDTNQLRDPTLREYLASSRTNFAVLPDYTSMEMYNGATVEQLLSTVEILSEFTRQVIVLKPTLQVCRLSGREAGLTRRLIDDRQTATFSEYCRHVQLAHDGNRQLRNRVMKLQAAAANHLNSRLIAAAPEFVAGMEGMVRETFADEELQALRASKRRLLPSTATKLLVCVFRLSGRVFDRHATTPQWPATFHELRNTFPFRFALCACTSMVDWITSGGNTSPNPSKIRNDMVDIGIAAYATYFDGLLSKDGKAARIHEHARVILDVVLKRVSDELATEWLQIAATARG